MDGGAWWAAVHGVTKSRTRLSDFTFTFHFHALEKEMATHSSVLGWRIQGTGKPGGLPSLGSHRVGHDWSDLAAAAAAGPWSWSQPHSEIREEVERKPPHCLSLVLWAGYRQLSPMALQRHLPLRSWNSVSFIPSLIWFPSLFFMGEFRAADLNDFLGSALRQFGIALTLIKHNKTKSW